MKLWKIHKRHHETFHYVGLKLWKYLWSSLSSRLWCVDLRALGSHPSRRRASAPRLAALNAAQRLRLLPVKTNGCESQPVPKWVSQSSSDINQDILSASFFLGLFFGGKKNFIAGKAGPPVTPRVTDPPGDHAAAKVGKLLCLTLSSVALWPLAPWPCLRIFPDFSSMGLTVKHHPKWLGMVTFGDLLVGLQELIGCGCF